MSLVKFRKRHDAVPSFFNFFDESFGKDCHVDFYKGTALSKPAVNIRETDENFFIDVAAPGLGKKDFNVSVEGDLLTISAEKEVKNEENSENFTRKEFSFNSFQRNFTLPETVNGDSISAKYDSGILHVVIPKLEEAKAKPARTVKIG